MGLSLDDLKSLINNPTESLDVEIKAWLDPSIPAGKAKIVKACVALRNNNGGFLIVGIQDDGSPDPNVPHNVREQFHIDIIQELVTKYAFHPFEVKVEFVERDGVEYPIICVPGGMETPVAVKSQMPDENGKMLLNNDDVYVRSLHSNNRVSSSRARAADWERIVRLCFDNREADIGAFIRRHLSGTNIDRLIEHFRPTEPNIPPSEQVLEFLEAGRQRFNLLQNENNNPYKDAGTREVAAVIDGDVPEFSPNEGFLNRLLLSMPRYTGWSPWVDTRSGSEDTKPYVVDNGWQAYIYTQIMGVSLDFWRIEPSGKFYHVRVFEDDMPHPLAQRPAPQTQLDFYLQVSRIAEILSNALSFAQAMECDEHTTSLAFAFRWSGLKGRNLSSWACPGRHFYSRGESHQDIITTKVAVPLESTLSGLAPFVEKAVVPLFSLFGGMKFESSVIEGIVRETLQRTY